MCGTCLSTGIRAAIRVLKREKFYKLIKDIIAHKLASKVRGSPTAR
jgi:hypothetical protein